MNMHNPPHPGEFINETYLQPYKMSCRYLANQLSVSPSTLSRVIKGQSSVTPEMALRLSKALGRTPESWLKMQDNHSLWTAKKTLNLSPVKAIDFNSLSTPCTT
ncbi:MAG: HigA family addiction module antitoxin [Desulfotalea sp.]